MTDGPIRLNEVTRAAVDSGRLVHLATINPDGTPQVTCVYVGWDGEEIVAGHLADHLKLRNIRRDPRVWLCALPDGFFGQWAQVEGTAEILELPAAMEPLVEYYRQISGEHPDWDDYRAAMERDKRVLLRIAVTKAGPSVSG